MNKINICHIVNIIDGKSDGIYTHLKMLFKYLDKKKYKQFLIFHGNSNIEKEVKKYGIEVYVLPSLSKKIPLVAFIKIMHFLIKNNINIVQTHLTKPYLIVGLINILLRKRAIHNLNGYLIFAPHYHSDITNKILKLIHLVIYVCRSYKCFLAPSYKSIEEVKKETNLLPQIFVYYNGCEIIKKAYHGKQFYAKQLYKIGVIARYEPQKRVDIAIKIAYELFKLRNDFHMFLVGNGSLEYKLRELINLYNANEYVTITGYIPNVRYFLNQFDLILLTSEYEGFPLVVWEAMAHGVPIIASDVGGTREIIEKEKCGIAYPFGDIQRAIHIIVFLLNNESIRKTMGLSGKKAIQEKYNNKTFTKRFDEIYTQLLTH